MVTITQFQLSLLCPSSCVVCSEDVIICHKLLNIIDAPGSTKALMLTDGLIDSVDNMVLSELSNMSVLALSNNAISSIMENAFQNLSFLTTLLLDHNRISSQSLDSSTFFWLHRLETLELGNNDLIDIDGSWFQSSRALKTLQLEGNRLTCLNSTTFAHADLRNLETLDLSNNLIGYLGHDSFRGLPHLRRLDLSRNHLRSAPNAFSYLSWLSVLNLDLNHWSCTCGVGITLGMIAIAYHKLSKKFELVQGENKAMERKTFSPESTQWNFCEGKDTLSMSHALCNSNYKSHQPWDREDSPYLGSDTMENHFTCHKCSPTALGVGKHKRQIVPHRANHSCKQEYKVRPITPFYGVQIKGSLDLRENRVIVQLHVDATTR
ncbi:leucine-rich repeat-containing 53 [Labeo rohita]|uniref:Leucine-rich repeat-containing 53 n=1 Tax=Labeo rohita TaxID=84645 RepID=A0A498MCE8_LABRO|nr:leucine-rich repeat-containing 53 [Labeo rohita]RXN39094.1 leucine-rich repeat-containing 53 [Labeo rohita]